MDGRDQELMDGLLSDAQTAVYGLPVTFSVVPFDTPILTVYINDEATGSIMWANGNPMDSEPHFEWWSVSTVTSTLTSHGDNFRAAIARHINEYVDKRVGLA